MPRRKEVTPDPETLELWANNRREYERVLSTQREPVNYKKIVDNNKVILLERLGDKSFVGEEVKPDDEPIYAHLAQHTESLREAGITDFLLDFPKELERARRSIIEAPSVTPKEREIWNRLHSPSFTTPEESKILDEQYTEAYAESQGTRNKLLNDAIQKFKAQPVPRTLIENLALAGIKVQMFYSRSSMFDEIQKSTTTPKTKIAAFIDSHELYYLKGPRRKDFYFFTPPGFRPDEPSLSYMLQQNSINITRVRFFGAPHPAPITATDILNSQGVRNQTFMIDFRMYQNAPWIPYGKGNVDFLVHLAKTS